MASTDAVETLQEPDEAIQQQPLPTAPQASTCSITVNIPVALPICHPPSASSWQKQKASPPELQRFNQTRENKQTSLISDTY